MSRKASPILATQWENPSVLSAFTIKWWKKQASSEDWRPRVAALETKFNFLLQFIRRLTEREEEKKKAMISKRQEEICPALSLSKAAQTLPTPRRPAFHVPRPSRTEPQQFQPLPIPVPQLYTLLRRAMKFDITSTKIPWEPLCHEPKKQGLLTTPRAQKELAEAVPQPFPYQDDKRVPWNYGMKVISTREGKPKTEEESGWEPHVRDLVGSLGVVRCYTPEELEKRRKEMGKAVEDPVKTKAAEDEAADFLRRPRKNEGSRRRGRGFLKDNQEQKALLKVLNEAYVPEGHYRTILRKHDIDPTRVRVTSMIVRAFDGTRREGDHGCTRPERYPLPYTRKMKLIIGNQLVTILAEEPISIYNDGAVPYIDGCASEEASFHSFEFVTVIHRVAAVEPKLSKAGIMVAREFVKAGFQPGQGLGCANQGRTAIVTLEGNKDGYGLGGEKWPEKKMVIPHIRTTFPASAMFQVDEGDVDELALLFTEDLSIDVITTEGDSTAPPIRPDHCKGVDLEDFLDEEDLKGYRIEEETLDEDTGKDTDFPNLLPHLMIPRGLETLEFEMFCEHGDPEFHLRRYHEKMALYTDDELLMISMFHESLPECAVTWFYQLKNIACWEDLARAFLDRYRHNLKSPPPSNATTTAVEEATCCPHD
uniref:Uncharacterized protein n=1 Tax=Fagus sylvatica TaxID=28930 RepID=A0A2N9IA67_FAGSY